MKKVKIGIDYIKDIYLRQFNDKLYIEDQSNDGFIECTIKNLEETIRIIEDVYAKRKNLNSDVYGYRRKTIQLSLYQEIIGKRIFKGNYIIISHMPSIIRMLKSVEVEKEKYILNNDSLLRLGIDDLIYLKQAMQKKKKVLTDKSGYKYVEV